MWNYMSRNPDVFVNSSAEGADRVRKGGYAYLVESTTNDYLKSQFCELTQIGGVIDDKGYGIAAPQGKLF